MEGDRIIRENDRFGQTASSPSADACSLVNAGSTPAVDASSSIIMHAQNCGKTIDKSNWHQSSTPCPACGSWYRYGSRCNICGAEVVPEPPQTGLRCGIGVRSGGRLWSKKIHRYLTEKEIKSGKKGG